MWRVSMNSKKENLGSLTYTMSDEEILEITKQIFRKKVINQNISEEEVDEILEKIPLTQQEIDLYVTLGDDRAALEEDNRKILAKRAWEKYLS